MYKFNNNRSSFPYKKESVVPVSGFVPKTYEQEVCWRIARELGEHDMRFILSCLKRYGLGHIERAWGLFRDMPQASIKNKAGYFNKLIRNMN